jgi:hypothetical protein
MVAVGTNALLRKGSRVRNIGVLLAVSTLLAARPSAADSQISPRRADYLRTDGDQESRSDGSLEAG